MHVSIAIQKKAHYVPDSMQPCHSNHYDLFTENTEYYYTLINVDITDQKTIKDNTSS